MQSVMRHAVMQTQNQHTHAKTKKRGRKQEEEMANKAIEHRDSASTVVKDSSFRRKVLLGPDPLVELLPPLAAQVAADAPDQRKEQDRLDVGLQCIDLVAA